MLVNCGPSDWKFGIKTCIDLRNFVRSNIVIMSHIKFRMEIYFLCLLCIIHFLLPKIEKKFDLKTHEPINLWKKMSICKLFRIKNNSHKVLCIIFSSFILALAYFIIRFHLQFSKMLFNDIHFP